MVLAILMALPFASAAITLERELPLQTPIAQIREWVQKPDSWWKLTYGAASSKAESDFVEITIPGKGMRRKPKWIRLKLVALSPETQPTLSWKMDLIANSKNQIPSEISDVHWAFEANPSSGTLRVKISAEPHDWRSKLWASLLPKVLLNQLLYWDLEKLAGIKIEKDPGLITITPER